MHWTRIEGWFHWRSAQEEAVQHFAGGGRFVEVGTYLGRSLCSLAEVVRASGRDYDVIGVDTCRGSGPEGVRQQDHHRAAVDRGSGTFAGELHRNVLECGYGGLVTLLITDSIRAAQVFPKASLDWVHLDARHDYTGLVEDIRAWLPRVRPGGWLSGDDYDPEKWPDVIRAVTDLLPSAEPWSVLQWRFVVE